MTASENNKRIAKNTLFLYFRMLFTMAIGLYTSRIVLNALEVENFGIYNVVGGVVTMLSFLNSSMTASTQRFLNYEMGKGNIQNLQIVFSNSINAHYIIATITLILLETVGLWFVYNKLNIPSGQFASALWVFHCSSFSIFVTIISTPYDAAIIANERMNIYAYFSITEVILKLLIAYLLIIIPFDKLKLYGLLLLGVSILMRILYNWYCIKNFKECKYKKTWERSIIKKIFSFSGWMLFGCLSDILSKQGVNMLINIFFGPVLNASRAVAFQIQTAVSTFVTNLMTAVRPQIIKSYSSKDYSYMYRLVFSSSRISFYVLLILCMPILIYTEFVLKLWLNQVPEFSVIFTRLTLIELLICTTYTPIAQINQASGKVKNYQLAISILFLVNFIMTYIMYKAGLPAYSTFFFSAINAIIGLFIRIIILKKENSFPAGEYLSKVMLPLIPITLLSPILPVYLYNRLPVNLCNFIMVSIIGLLCNVSTIWIVGLNKQEKRFLLNHINKIKKAKK
jgi:O-antigen/teichoic acid export membrane protein